MAGLPSVVFVVLVYNIIIFICDDFFFIYAVREVFQFMIEFYDNSHYTLVYVL